MSYAILRTAKLKKMGNIAGSLGHTFRSLPTPNADPTLTHLNINSHANYDEAFNAVKAKMPEKLRKNGVMCIEYLITGSPEWEGWDNQQKDDYFADSIKWLEAKHGKENILVTSIQLDETTPHLVAYVLPITPTGKMSAGYFLDGRKKMIAMQTDFADKVGAKYGLERGVEGSKATHTTIKQFYTDIQKPVPKVDDLQIVLPAKGLLERADDYQNKVNNIVVEAVTPQLERVQSLQNALAIVERDNDNLRAELKDLRVKSHPYLVAIDGLKPEKKQNLDKDLEQKAEALHREQRLEKEIKARQEREAELQRRAEQRERAKQREEAERAERQAEHEAFLRREAEAKQREEAERAERSRLEDLRIQANYERMEREYQKSLQAKTPATNAPKPKP